MEEGSAFEGFGVRLAFVSQPIAFKIKFVS